MHGKAKVKTCATEQEKKKKEREAKVAAYRQLMAQLWDKRKKEEFDDEALNLITEVLSRNPDIYTLWNFRRQILSSYLQVKRTEELSKDLKTELNLTESCIKVNPKSYSAWHHRQWLMGKFPEPNLQKEMELCTIFLKMDDRNFHCWDYRRWVAAKLNVPDEKELEYTMELINENFSNYSSWHYRSKLLPRVYPDPANVRPINEQMHLNELELVMNAAFTDPNDQSAWFYQRWLLGRPDSRPKPVRALLHPEGGLMVAFSCPVTPTQIKLVTPDDTLNTHFFTSSLVVWNSYSIPANGSEVEMIVCGVSFKLKLSLDSESKCYSWSNGLGLELTPLSSALTAVLSDQLNMCNQLLEYDPDSKWTLLTSVYIMIILDRHKFRDDIMKRLNLLQEYDPLRINYYTYLICKYTIEYHLDNEKADFCLSSSSLNSVVHTQYLLLAKTVNLSENQLDNSVLSDLISLQSCQKLKLDGNRISSLDELPSLPCLESLSLSRNNIKNFQDVLPYLSRFPLLKSLDLSQNPVIGIDTPSCCGQFPQIDFVLSS